MAIETAKMLQYRGAYTNFDASKLLPGQLAVVTSGDPYSATGKALYCCFAGGDVKRIVDEDNIGVPTLEQIEMVIANWLDNHPEATTTVEDQSVTVAKLAEDVLEMFNQKAPYGQIETYLTASTDDAIESAINDTYDAMQDKTIKHIILNIGVTGLKMSGGRWHLEFYRFDSEHGYVIAKIYKSDFAIKTMIRSKYVEWGGWTTEKTAIEVNDLYGRVGNLTVPHYPMILITDSVTDYAVNTLPNYCFTSVRLGGEGYTGEDLPGYYYKFGSCMLFKRAANSIYIIIFPSSLANNVPLWRRYDSTGWSDWYDFTGTVNNTGAKTN